MSRTRASEAPSSALPAIPSQSRRPVVDVVGSLAAISLGRIDEGRAFTWTATDDAAAVLDACQYLAGGPCVTAAQEGRLVEHTGIPGAEDGTLFARASAAAGVGAILSIPVAVGGDGGCYSAHHAEADAVVGTVNLYARNGMTFEGRHDDLARWCATWAPARALARTAPTFDSRLARGLTPERQRDQNSVDCAVALLARLLGTDVADAAQRLRMAALRAGTSESSLARALNATAT